MKKNNAIVGSVIGWLGFCAITYVGCKFGEVAWNAGEKAVYKFKHRNDVPVCPVFAQYGGDKAEIIKAYESATDTIKQGGCVPHIVVSLSEQYIDNLDANKHQDLIDVIKVFLEAYEEADEDDFDDECSGCCTSKCDCHQEDSEEVTEEAPEKPDPVKEDPVEDSRDEGNDGSPE